LLTEDLDPHQRGAIRAVCSDRNRPYLNAVAAKRRWFDTAVFVKHPRGSLNILHRLTAFALGLAFIGANASLCAGWAATPEARMACCVEGDDCPMHKGESHVTGSEHMPSQAQADDCCAASERHQSSQTDPVLAAANSGAVLGAGVVVPVSIPALVLSDGWRTDAPIRTSPVPRHILLSIFLV
jgi:hypothetical protein